MNGMILGLTKFVCTPEMFQENNGITGAVATSTYEVVGTDRIIESMLYFANGKPSRLHVLDWEADRVEFDEEKDIEIDDISSIDDIKAKRTPKRIRDLLKDAVMEYLHSIGKRDFHILMERDEIVFLDSLVVISADGSWSTESLELAPLREEEDDQFGFARARRDGYRNAEVLLPLYKAGKLSGEGLHTEFNIDQITEVDGKQKDIGYVDFVLRADRLPDEVWKRLKDNIPMSPCRASGCVAVTNPIMITYREWYGSISKSWECGLVQVLNCEHVSEVSRIWHEKEDAFAAGLECLKILNCKEEEEEK